MQINPLLLVLVGLGLIATPAVVTHVSGQGSSALPERIATTTSGHDDCIKASVAIAGGGRIGCQIGAAPSVNRRIEASGAVFLSARGN